MRLVVVDILLQEGSVLALGIAVCCRHRSHMREDVREGFTFGTDSQGVIKSDLDSRAVLRLRRPKVETELIAKFGVCLRTIKTLRMTVVGGLTIIASRLKHL